MPGRGSTDRCSAWRSSDSATGLVLSLVSIGLLVLLVVRLAANDDTAEADTGVGPLDGATG